MLLLSAVLMSTASFAWFSMNTQVTATGFQVSAISDASALVINTGEKFDPSGNAFTATSGGTAITLLPVMPKETLTSTNIETASSWQYGYSTDPASSTVSGGYTTVSGDLMGNGNYLGKDTFYVGLQTGSTAATENLYLRNITLPTGNTGVNVVIVVGTTVYNSTTSAGDISVDLGVVPTTSGTAVNVYYYINGEDTAVYTNNISALKGTVSFTIGIGAAHDTQPTT